MKACDTNSIKKALFDMRLPTDSIQKVEYHNKS